MNIELIPNSHDLFVIQPKIYTDQRGYFLERFQHKLLEETCGFKIDFIQQNESFSSKNVVRGLHYQIQNTQSKLVTVIKGAVLDVVVDLRKNSSTFANWWSIELDSEKKNSLFVPKGFAHGFGVLSNEAIFSYMVDAPYDPMSEKTILWNDTSLNIDWKISDPLVSTKDSAGVKFTDAIYF